MRPDTLSSHRRRIIEDGRVITAPTTTPGDTHAERITPLVRDNPR